MQRSIEKIIFSFRAHIRKQKNGQELTRRNKFQTLSACAQKLMVYNGVDREGFQRTAGRKKKQHTSDMPLA